MIFRAAGTSFFHVVQLFNSLYDAKLLGFDGVVNYEAMEYPDDEDAMLHVYDGVGNSHLLIMRGSTDAKLLDLDGVYNSLPTCSLCQRIRSSS